MTITAFFSPGIAGYGHRLFIPGPALELLNEPFDEARYEQLSTANDVLKNLSCWRGSDKRWIIDGVEYWGYEFSKKLWDAEAEYAEDTSRSNTRQQIEAAGIIIKDFAEERDGRKAAGRPLMKIESVIGCY